MHELTHTLHFQHPERGAEEAECVWMQIHSQAQTLHCHKKTQMHVNAETHT